MTVYLLMKHYGHDDRSFVHSIYLTRELAEKAKEKELLVNPDQEDDFECWVCSEEVISE